MPWAPGTLNFHQSIYIKLIYLSRSDRVYTNICKIPETFLTRLVGHIRTFWSPSRKYEACRGVSFRTSPPFHLYKSEIRPSTFVPASIRLKTPRKSGQDAHVTRRQREQVEQHGNLLDTTRTASGKESRSLLFSFYLAGGTY